MHSGVCNYIGFYLESANGTQAEEDYWQNIDFAIIGNIEDNFELLAEESSKQEEVNEKFLNTI